jgi:membrane protein implicated in regulation of membrane protease activity
MPLKFPQPPLSTYVLAHLPGWTVVLFVSWILVAWVGLPVWAGLLLIATLVLKDVLSYRTMRHYYTSEPSERRLVNRPAVVVTPLSPRGMVRVHGELWQARIHCETVLPPGAVVRIREVEGLLLIVDQDGDVNAIRQNPIS